jgi:hypothetical protein
VAETLSLIFDLAAACAVGNPAIIARMEAALAAHLGSEVIPAA